jgi:hypothetical protein
MLRMSPAQNIEIMIWEVRSVVNYKGSKLQQTKNELFVLFVFCTGDTTGTGPVPGVPGPAVVGPPKNPGPGWSLIYTAPKTPVPGGL